ncbi:MAG: hypothetical protein HY791_07145 [Deltaproteobacteria bacterium]|nr:hypothetical protein [Deltaproteobacteria bacterium]
MAVPLWTLVVLNGSSTELELVKVTSIVQKSRMPCRANWSSSKDVVISHSHGSEQLLE